MILNIIIILNSGKKGVYNLSVWFGEHETLNQTYEIGPLVSSAVCDKFFSDHTVKFLRE